MSSYSQYNKGRLGTQEQKKIQQLEKLIQQYQQQQQVDEEKYNLLHDDFESLNEQFDQFLEKQNNLKELNVNQQQNQISLLNKQVQNLQFQNKQQQILIDKHKQFIETKDMQISSLSQKLIDSQLNNKNIQQMQSEYDNRIIMLQEVITQMQNDINSNYKQYLMQENETKNSVQINTHIEDQAYTSDAQYHSQQKQQEEHIQAPSKIVQEDFNNFINDDQTDKVWSSHNNLSTIFDYHQHIIELNNKLMDIQKFLNTIINENKQSDAPQLICLYNKIQSYSELFAQFQTNYKLSQDNKQIVCKQSNIFDDTSNKQLLQVVNQCKIEMEQQQLEEQSLINIIECHEEQLTQSKLIQQNKQVQLIELNNEISSLKEKSTILINMLNQNIQVNKNNEQVIITQRNIINDLQQKANTTSNEQKQFQQLQGISSQSDLKHKYLLQFLQQIQNEAVILIGQCGCLNISKPENQQLHIQQVINNIITNSYQTISQTETEQISQILERLFNNIFDKVYNQQEFRILRLSSDKKLNQTQSVNFELWQNKNNDNIQNKGLSTDSLTMYICQHSDMETTSRKSILYNLESEQQNNVESSKITQNLLSIINEKDSNVSRLQSIIQQLQQYITQLKTQQSQKLRINQEQQATINCQCQQVQAYAQDELKCNEQISNCDNNQISQINEKVNQMLTLIKQFDIEMQTKNAIQQDKKQNTQKSIEEISDIQIVELLQSHQQLLESHISNFANHQEVIKQIKVDDKHLSIIQQLELIEQVIIRCLKVYRQQYNIIDQQ